MKRKRQFTNGLLVGSGVTSKVPRYKEATALHSTKRGIDVSGWLVWDGNINGPFTFPFARYGSFGATVQFCSLFGARFQMSWWYGSAVWVLVGNDIAFAYSFIADSSLS
jgi:hypothetical protein